MTTAVPVSEPRPLASSRSPAWAPLGELLVVGGATPLLFVASWLLRRALGLDLAELAVGFTMFHAAFVINDPHFSVTYLLFYRDARARAFGEAFTPALRARYLVAGILVPLVLAVWAVVGLATGSARTLGWMIQLMFLLVGWHYIKQGFGVMAVLASRRGVTFRPRERLVILIHCYAAWACTFAAHAHPGREVEEKGLVYTNLPLPAGLAGVTRAVLAVSVVALVAVLVRKWRREGRLPLVTPLTALLASVWAWSIFSGIDPLVRYAVPALHSVQYLYFVWLLESTQARERERAPWFETSAKVRLGILAASALGLGWFLFHGAPWALDDGPVSARARLSDMGPTPYFAALYTFVNIHHYFMDNVIWRRDNPLMRYLRRPAAPAVGA